LRADRNHPGGCAWYPGSVGFTGTAGRINFARLDDLTMIDEQLRVELLAMKAEDLRVREALLACGELSGPYAPQMEVVHKRNAEQLRKIIKIHGWPAEDVAGVDGAEAAWLIAQHAIGEPGFQKHALTLLESCAAAGRVPGWQAAYLKDRIAMCDGEA